MEICTLGQIKTLSRKINVFLGGISFLLGCFLWISQPQLVQAVTESSPSTDTSTDSELTGSGSAEVMQKVSTVSAEVQQIIKEKKDQDITETSGEKKNKLIAYLDKHPASQLSWHNPLQLMLRAAIEKGLPVNLIVLILLFPLIASIIAASRHVIGLTGFGIYTPAVLSVAFVSTGIATGVIIFMAVLAASLITHKLLRKSKLPYLPRTSMLLWGVSVVMLLFFTGTTLANISTFLTVNIFPLLIIILLTENFLETQFFSSQNEATRLTVETLFLATSGAMLIGWEETQKIVLLFPEATLLGILAINILIGQYKGLRLLEYIRFQSLLERK